MNDNKIIKREIKKIIKEEVFQEERISNKNASDEVLNRKNFVGSHTYGEDLGDLGLMYVAYSYGEQHPLYVWDNDHERWYHNSDSYILPDGKPNRWTKKHLVDLRPNSETQGRPTSFLVSLINNFKNKNGIISNTHSDLEPGEK